jgi:uncharacterized protein YeeX (DUF496 family)
MKNFFEYIIKEQNKTFGEEIKDFREEMKQDRKALEDSMGVNTAKLQNEMTEIEKSVKSSELES